MDEQDVAQPPPAVIGLSSGRTPAMPITRAEDGPTTAGGGCATYSPEHLQHAHHFRDRPRLGDAAVGAVRGIGLVDLGELAEAAPEHLVEQGLEGGPGLALRRLAELAEAQHRFAIGADEPRPDGALVVRLVALERGAL